MDKLGLALSGGGFRASLYHLGLVRFLRDAGILPKVTHITSVSGGSILAAHLVLNWDRYNGSPNDFDAAASEVLSFVRLDVRNRITRRFPLTISLRWPRRLLGLSNRKLSRTGLLEYHYEKYLYGDTSLFELREKPQLHILATNVSEGCLCSFNRNGLLMVRRQPGHTFRLDRVHTGLATVAMAVAASSAFPGFFPPLELTGADVGANTGEFGRQAYTDGGVFDNLGVRMFRCLERPLLADSPLSREDFLDFPGMAAALCQASKSSDDTPLRRLAQILAGACSRPGLLPISNGPPDANALQPVSGSGLSLLPSSAEAGPENGEKALMSILWELLRHYQFHREPLLAALKPADPDAEMLLQGSRSGRQVLDPGDQLWLNRHLFEAAYRLATGQGCFRRLHSGLDGVLVSDVGKRIQARGDRRAGGVIRTAMRATDILMDRVWQLETETFRGTPGFVFAPITEVIDPADDETVLHPEIQRQTANIRTDLDRFSMLEISSLIRHGYCVARKTCRDHPELFGSELPGNAPWDPVSAQHDRANPVPVRTRLDGASREPAATTVEARTLQASGLRRIWSTLLDRRDWVSYLYVPILVPILFLLPYFVVKSYQNSQRINQLIESLSQGTGDFEHMKRLLEDGPEKLWTGVAAEEVADLDQTDLKGFVILQDSLILDLRNWTPGRSAKGESSSVAHGYRRLKVLKQPDHTGDSIFRLRLLPVSPKTEIRFPQQRLVQSLRKSRNLETSVPGQKECTWQMVCDFQKVPGGETVELRNDFQSPGQFLEAGENGTVLRYQIQGETAELTTWILMPRDMEYRNFRIGRYETSKPEKVEAVKLVTQYLSNDNTIIAYKLLALKAGFTYEVNWDYE